MLVNIAGNLTESDLLVSKDQRRILTTGKCVGRYYSTEFLCGTSASILLLANCGKAVL